MTRCLTAQQHEFLHAIDALGESKRRQEMLLLAATVYEPEMTQGRLEEETRESFKQKYGSVIALFLLITIAGAAISWAVERLLDWLYPNDKWGDASNERHKILLRYQRDCGGPC